MTWAQRKKITYIVSVLFIFAIILAVILFSFFNKKPTCFDGIQNQGEKGIDCGGPCNVLCRSDYFNPIIAWGPRWEKVPNNGTYNFLTYIQNPNAQAGAYNAPYDFRVYDNDNVLLYQKTDMAFIPPNSNFVIFEDDFTVILPFLSH